MIVIPAIDLRGGKCVRLIQGKLEEETVFSDDPVAMAQKWVQAGAKRLHLVDLDGAFAGRPVNLPIIKEIAAAIDIPVQMGGGVRDIETVSDVLNAGVQWVILGTSAISQPDLVKEAVQRYGDRIICGIDAKDGLVAIRGWADVVEKTAIDLALEMKEVGIKTIIYTDIRRDGMMGGPNIESTQALAEKTGINIIASGGVSTLQDIINLKAVSASGIAGVITGKAIYTGSIDLAEAMQITEGEE